jgi:hypothetical protein
MSCATDNEISATRRKSYHAQHMTDSKKTQHARENSQQKRAAHRKVTVHQKMGQRSEKKKPVIRVKRHELSIYET